MPAVGVDVYDDAAVVTGSPFFDAVHGLGVDVPVQSSGREDVVNLDMGGSRFVGDGVIGRDLLEFSSK